MFGCLFLINSGFVMCFFASVLVMQSPGGMDYSEF